MNFKDLLQSIPIVKKDELLSNKILIDDIANIHHTLTLDNPMTYIIYMHYEKSLTTEQRNDIYRIIDRLKNNDKNTYEAIIEKHKLEPACAESDLTPLKIQTDDEEDERPIKVYKKK